MATKWISIKDRCFQEIFEFHKSLKPFTMIKELMDGGQIITKKEDIKEYVRSFYHHLYTKGHLVENIQVRVQCFKTIPTILTKDKNKFLLQEFIDIAVCRAIRNLPKHKAPRIDGVPMEFFHDMWQEVGTYIKNLLQETFQERRMHKELKTSLQSSIPKSGNHNLITNYKPISLLGSTYKIA
jgi:hypothetical protein